MPKTQSEFGTGSSEDAFGRPEYTAFENQQYGPAYDGSEIVIGKQTPNGIQKLRYSADYDKDKLKFWNIKKS